MDTKYKSIKELNEALKRGDITLEPIATTNRIMIDEIAGFTREDLAHIQSLTREKKRSTIEPYYCGL